MKQLPNLQLEIELWKKGFTVAGIDEVGRGSFAGPLVVGAVVFPPAVNREQITKLLSLGINDSKKLSGNKRNVLTKVIQELCSLSQIEYISHDIINRFGMTKALSMGFANISFKILKKCPKTKIFFLTDAYKIPTVEKTKQLNIIRGDSTSLSIAAASIVAKVDRDNYMEKLAGQFPEYGFEKHKGYGTLYHRQKIKLYGPSPIHRTEFVKNHI